MKHPFALLALLLAATTASAASEPELTLKIVMEHSFGQLPILDWGQAERHPHFHVLLTNMSEQPIHFVKNEYNTWFEVTDELGKTWTARRRPFPYATTGKATFFALNPAESSVIEINFSDRGVWADDFWLPPGHPLGRITLRAVYESRSEATSQWSPVWKGRITSQPVECSIR